MIKSFFYLSAAALCGAGCAYPHRASMTLHELRRYEGRPDGLVMAEIWKDSEKGGGCFLFADPDVQAFLVTHVNQTDLGGSNVISTGPMKITVDPQTGAIIEAGGAAVGSALGTMIGTTIKSSLGLPPIPKLP